MTSHNDPTPNDQLKGLISEIDEILSRPPGLLGRLAGDRPAHRATLAHLRTYLLGLQNNLRRARIQNHPLAGDLPALLGEAQARGQLVAAGERSPTPPAQPAIPGQSEASQALLYQLGQDLTQLRSNLLGPLQAEVQQLRQQRQALAQEVRQLETQRQQLRGGGGIVAARLLADPDDSPPGSAGGPGGGGHPPEPAADVGAS